MVIDEEEEATSSLSLPPPEPSAVRAWADLGIIRNILAFTGTDDLARALRVSRIAFHAGVRVLYSSVDNKMLANTLKNTRDQDRLLAYALSVKRLIIAPHSISRPGLIPFCVQLPNVQTIQIGLPNHATVLVTVERPTLRRIEIVNVSYQDFHLFYRAYPGLVGDASVTRWRDAGLVWRASDAETYVRALLPLSWAGTMTSWYDDENVETSQKERGVEYDTDMKAIAATAQDLGDTASSNLLSRHCANTIRDMLTIIANHSTPDILVIDGWPSRTGLEAHVAFDTLYQLKEELRRFRKVQIIASPPRVDILADIEQYLPHMVQRPVAWPTKHVSLVDEIELVIILDDNAPIPPVVDDGSFELHNMPWIRAFAYVFVNIGRPSTRYVIRVQRAPTISSDPANQEVAEWTGRVSIRGLSEFEVDYKASPPAHREHSDTEMDRMVTGALRGEIARLVAERGEVAAGWRRLPTSF